jgi:DNA repair exonuclease SbcCD ATPase subunit
MIEFQYLEAENIGPIKNIHLPLNHVGVSMIRGKNLDSIENDSNGVGKTALFGSIPNLLYFEPPNSVKKKSAKTFLGDTGRVALAFNNNQEQTKITQFSKGSSVKYEITQNDEPLKIHKTRSTQEAIQALFPLTISQYYTTVYLNAVSNNRILMGRGTERMDLFESLFSLEAHASMHEEIKAQYDATLQAQNSKKLFENELDSLGEPADIKKLKFARADLENLADQLRKKHDRQ